MRLIPLAAELVDKGTHKPRREPVPGRVYPRCGPAPSRRTRLARDPDIIARQPGPHSSNPTGKASEVGLTFAQEGASNT